LPLDEAIDAEAQAQAACMESNDFRRAYEAFMAKRTPQFEGN
jgi:enoyl-CoA hydratase/carnithine racemase